MNVGALIVGCPIPANSQAQQRLFAIAEHNPSQLYKKNRGLLKLSHSQLHDFASTPRKGLPKLAKKPVSVGDLMKGESR